MEAHKELVAKKLRTGEIAVWDPESRSIVLISQPSREGKVEARAISGAAFRALEEELSAIVVLV